MRPKVSSDMSVKFHSIRITLYYRSWVLCGGLVENRGLRLAGALVDSVECFLLPIADHFVAFEGRKQVDTAIDALDSGQCNLGRKRFSIRRQLARGER